MNIFIVSGLSGSGKSIALQALEDLGYYCIDNLPAVLLAEFAGQLLNSEGAKIDRAAVSIDSRNQLFLESLPEHLHKLHALGIDYRIIFLEADDRALVKRFSETRRKHPLSNDDTSLLESIRQERELLAPLSDHASRRINTAATTPHELRRMVRDIAGGEQPSGAVLMFESFGYKHGTPLDADFVFDVRCLPNPHWQPELRPMTGLDSPVIEFLESHAPVIKMVEQIQSFIEYWLPSFEAENRSYITIAIGCTGGQHRSVYISQKLSDYFAHKQIHVQTRHRELKLRDANEQNKHDGGIPAVAAIK
ncbi:MAG: RNase adapter RapZ [Gammaproteobacteria bacterium]|nr:RNase adapter RapZ [Gammaproteobacteria bacterium]